MAYTIQDLIRNEVKRPVRQAYIKRRDIDGNYEAAWVRLDIKDGINRVINWGVVSFDIDAERNVLNSFDIGSYSLRVTNQDGTFNSRDDSRSLWSGFLDHKDTKIRVEVAMKDPDDNEIGLIDVFEGVIQSIDLRAANVAVIKSASYSKKLKEYNTLDLSLAGVKSVSTIITSIMNQSKITTFIPFGNVTISPVEDIDIDTSVDDLKGSYWDSLKFLAKTSGSTIYVENDALDFKSRAAAGASVFTFAGLSNTQTDRTKTIYSISSYDPAGSDKLFTKIFDESSGATAETTDAILLQEGKEITLSLGSVNTFAEKQDIVDAYLARWGVRRPSIRLLVPFMMFLVKPFNIINIDNPGAKTEIDAGYYDASVYDGTAVYDGSGGSTNIDKNVDFVVEKAGYDIHEWQTLIFARQDI